MEVVNTLLSSGANICDQVCKNPMLVHFSNSILFHFLDLDSQRDGQLKFLL